MSAELEHTENRKSFLKIKMENNLEELCIKDGKLVDSKGNEVEVERHVNPPIFVRLLINKIAYDDKLAFELTMNPFLKRLGESIEHCHEHANAFLRGDAVSLSDKIYSYGYSVQLYQIKKA